MKELFNLIGELSMNEKRYFKTHITSKNALKLFDQINDHPTDFNAVNAFSPREKNYLLNCLLRTLRGYHAEMSVNRRIDNYIHEVDILINKELYDLAHSRIRQAEKLAITYEKTYQQLCLNRLKKKIMQYEGEEDITLFDQCNEIIEELSLCIVAECEIEKIIHRCRVKNFSKDGFDPKKEVDNIFKKLPSKIHPAIKTNSQYMGLMAHITSQLENKDALALNYHKELVNKFEFQMPHMSNSSLDNFSKINFVGLLHNMLSILSDMGDAQEYFDVFEKLKNIKGLCQRDNKKRILNIAISITDYCIKKNRGKQGLDFIAENKKILESVTTDPGWAEMLYFNISYLHFLEKQYKEARKAVLKYVTVKKPHFRLLHKATLFYNIIIHIEMGNPEFAYNLIEKVVKKLKAEANYSPFDNIIAQLLRAYLSSSGTKKFARHFLELSKYIDSDKEKQSSVNLNLFFDFKNWAALKLNKKNISMGYN